jgi:hypothetical protein
MGWLLLRLYHCERSFQMSNWYMGVPLARGVLNVIGQCNPESDHPNSNLWPLPYGSVGHHLWQMFVAGDKQTRGQTFTRTDYLEVTVRHGLCYGDEFDAAAAKIRARVMMAGGIFEKPTLLLGRAVADAVLSHVNWGGCPSRYGNFYFIANPTSNNKAYENKAMFEMAARYCADALRTALKIEAEKSGFIFHDDGTSEYTSRDMKNV